MTTNEKVALAFCVAYCAGHFIGKMIDLFAAVIKYRGGIK